MFEVVSVISPHFDVDGHQNFDVPLPGMRPFPPSTPLPTSAAAAATAAAVVGLPDVVRFRR